MRSAPTAVVYRKRTSGMIEAKAIYRVSCDKCLKHMRINTESIELALAALKQSGWKVDYDDGLLETICPDCVKEGERNG